jgi:flagellar biogenesis protein FliO
MTGGAGDLAMLGRVMGGLIVVIVLIGLIAKLARRSRGYSGNSGLRVVDRVGLSREANLAVVEVSNRMLLLGVTAQGVTMLADLDQADPAETRPKADFEADFDDELAFEPDLAPYSEHESEPYLEPEPGSEPIRVDLSDPELDLINTIDDLTVVHGLRPEPPPIPAEVALDEYPDLASALRAAGRTAGPIPVPSWAQAATQAEISDADFPDQVPVIAPRTRAEARAQERPTARNWNPLPRNRSVLPAGQSAPAPDPAPTSLAEPEPIAARPKGPRRVVVSSTTQASGSVLSPNTWRQGIEALRELTVRRG